MKTTALIIAIGTLFSACNSENSQKQGKTEPGSEQENKVVNEYLDLKNALVKSDPSAAKKEANELKQELEAAKDAPTAFIDHISVIVSSSDIAQQREAFSELSNHLIGFLKSRPGEHPHLYIQHCPMALNDKGASWISDEEEIKNPYYGDEMLTCGEVTEEIN